jgi:hypothetical protein
MAAKADPVARKFAWWGNMAYSAWQNFVIRTPGQDIKASEHMQDRSYRLYHLCKDGHIRGAVNRDFHDDREALAYASMMLDIHPGVEVWQTHRLVGRVDAVKLAS